MIFIINAKKYDTDKMEMIADVKKWYELEGAARMIFGKGMGKVYDCHLWKSQKENWLLTHDTDYKTVGEAITESEAKDLLMKYNPDKYEELFEEIPEA